MDSHEQRHHAAGYQLFMLVLCFYALAMLAAEALVDFKPQTRELLNDVDYVICSFFFIDFIVCMVQAHNRWHYFFAELGFIDLLSCIPMMNVARLGRAARIFRIFRVLRGLKATRVIAMMLLHRRKENTFLAVSLVTILMVVFSSMAILHFETGSESKIRTADDAIWWAVATVATVGYGDLYPVTPEGRFVAALLMVAGVGLFGTFSGFLAAWFVSSGEAKRESELDAIKNELKALRMLLEERNAKG